MLDLSRKVGPLGR